MRNFAQNFGLSSSPFEKYVAENEPDINAYAVTPPYFEETRKRTASNTSFILFGFRGSGKSATRLTNEQNNWATLATGERSSIIVNLTNFEPLLARSSADALAANRIIAQVAFLFVETVLLWISNQEEKEQYIELLTDDERRHFSRLVRLYYLNVDEPQRRVSLAQAMRIMKESWKSKAGYWVDRKWDSISSLVANVIAKLGEKHIDPAAASQNIKQLMQAESPMAAGGWPS